MRPGWPKILACPYTLEDREGIDINLLNRQNAAVLLVPDASSHWPGRFGDIECPKWMYQSSTVCISEDIYSRSVAGALKSFALRPEWKWQQIGETEILPNIYNAQTWWEFVDTQMEMSPQEFDMTFLDCWFDSLRWATNTDEHKSAWKEYLIRMRRTAKKWGNRIIINGYPHGSRRTLAGRMIENVPNRSSWFPLLFGGHGIYDAAQNKEFMHPRTVIISEYEARHRKVCLALSMILGTYMAPKGNRIIQVLHSPDRDAGMWLPKGPYSISDDGLAWARPFRHWKDGRSFTVTVIFDNRFRMASAALPFGVM